MMKLKVAIITGANSSIGHQIIRVFLENNWQVHATLRSKRKNKNLIVHNNLVYHEMDLECPRTVSKTIAKIGRKEEKIDVIINNAGFVLSGPFESYTEKQIRREMNVNFMGTLLTIKAVLPFMKKQGYGCIVNVSSICGLTSFPLFSLYHASKWALEGFSESIRYELEPLGIRIKLIEPGGVKDNDTSSKVELGELPSLDYENLMKAVHQNTSWFPGFSTAAQVAELIYIASIDQSNKLRYIIGQESSIFLKERFEGFANESFIDKMKNRIFNPKK
ncbi:MAG: SDR family oxidoreductase [bacterium]|nr:SDR family oxidoreductase [bacterium]